MGLIYIVNGADIHLIGLIYIVDGSDINSSWVRIIYIFDGMDFIVH